MASYLVDIFETGSKFVIPTQWEWIVSRFGCRPSSGVRGLAMQIGSLIEPWTLRDQNCHDA